VIRIADVTVLLLSNTLFTMLVTKTQFYYFDRCESHLLIRCLLKFMFGTACVISLASFSLEQAIVRLWRQSGIQKIKLHSTSKCTIMYIMYFTINLFLQISVQFPSSGSHTNVVKTYSNTMLQQWYMSKVQVLVTIQNNLKLYYKNYGVLCRWLENYLHSSWFLVLQASIAFWSRLYPVL
jgi:hypothetical protein